MFVLEENEYKKENIQCDDSFDYRNDLQPTIDLIESAKNVSQCVSKVQNILLKKRAIKLSLLVSFPVSKMNVSLKEQTNDYYPKLLNRMLVILDSSVTSTMKALPLNIMLVM